MTSNYNNIASFYDFLSKMVFGNAIINAQRFLVEAIPAKSTVLIVGGGTGWILEEIAKVHSEGLEIAYVEPSEKMVSMSEKRNAGFNEVIFINKTVEEVEFPNHFDIVITPFLFDNFSSITSNQVFQKIDGCLVPDGVWLFVDLQPIKKGVLWQHMLLKIMYLFFKLVCQIEANSLHDTTVLFHQYKYKLISSRTFFKNFICSSVYKKCHGCTE
jgi:ubiquinone/menaquinone biosynthesis C-methylase UbiE